MCINFNIIIKFIFLFSIFFKFKLNNKYVDLNGLTSTPFVWINIAFIQLLFSIYLISVDCFCSSSVYIMLSMFVVPICFAKSRKFYKNSRDCYQSYIETWKFHKNFENRKLKFRCSHWLSLYFQSAIKYNSIIAIR